MAQWYLHQLEEGNWTAAEIDDVSPKPIYDHRFKPYNNEANFETNYWDQSSADRNCPSNDVMRDVENWPFLREGTETYHRRIHEIMAK